MATSRAGSSPARQTAWGGSLRRIGVNGERRLASGGNPGAYLSMFGFLVESFDTPAGTAIDMAFTTTAPLEGAPFVLALDGRVPGVNQCPGSPVPALIVEQGGNVFASQIGPAPCAPDAWAQETYRGVLKASDFNMAVGMNVFVHPVFADGVRTRFGFASGFGSADYGNVRLDFEDAPVVRDVPAVSTPLVRLMLSLVVLLMARRHPTPRRKSPGRSAAP
jgi:hypothetical protein